MDIARPRRIGSVRLTELEAEVLNRVMQRSDNEVQLRKQQLKCRMALPLIRPTREW